jgi:hypothetical protein
MDRRKPLCRYVCMCCTRKNSVLVVRAVRAVADDSVFSTVRISACAFARKASVPMGRAVRAVPDDSKPSRARRRYGLVPQIARAALRSPLDPCRTREPSYSWKQRSKASLLVTDQVQARWSPSRQHNCVSSRSPCNEMFWTSRTPKVRIASEFIAQAFAVLGFKFPYFDPNLAV